MADVIETDRLILRPYRTSDAGVVARSLDNINVSRWLTRVPHPYTRQDALNFFAMKSGSSDAIYAVCDEDELVGCVSIQSELGYWYGEQFWGRGYATEAARALMARHFSSTSDTVPSGYHLGNAGSKRVLEKLGFQPTGVRTAHSRSQGVDVTIQGMELTKTRWDAHQ